MEVRMILSLFASKIYDLSLYTTYVIVWASRERSGSGTSSGNYAIINLI